MFSAHGFTKALPEARSCDQRYPTHDTRRRRGGYGATPSYNVSAYVFGDDYVQLVADDYQKMMGEVEFVLATYPQGADDHVMKQLVSGQGDPKPRAGNKTTRHHDKLPSIHRDQLPSHGDKNPWHYGDKDNTVGDRDKLVRSIDKMVKQRDEMLRHNDEEYYLRHHLTAPGHRDEMLRHDEEEQEEFYSRDHLTARGDRGMTHPPGGSRRGSRMPRKAPGKKKQEVKGGQVQSPFSVLYTVPRKEKPEQPDEKHTDAHDSTKGQKDQKFDIKEYRNRSYSAFALLRRHH